MPSPYILYHNTILPLIQAAAPLGKLIQGCICLHSIFLVTVGLFSYFESSLKIRGGGTFSDNTGDEVPLLKLPGNSLASSGYSLAVP